MGMSTHIVGFKPPDEKWKKMKAIYDACSAGDVELPDEVDDFFGGETPDPAGVTVDLEDLDAVEDYSAKGSEGFEVNLKKLPKDITIIRFYNAF